MDAASSVVLLSTEVRAAQDQGRTREEEERQKEDPKEEERLKTKIRVDLKDLELNNAKFAHHLDFQKRLR